MPQQSVSLATVTALSPVTPGKTFHTSEAGIKPKPRERRVDTLFSGVGRAKDPGHLPAEGERHLGKVVALHAVVADPYRRGHKQKVAINAHRDALATDLKYKRIKAEEYAAGVTYRAMLELSHGMPKTSAGDYLQPIGGNKVNGQALRMVALIEQGDNCRLFFRDTCKIIGMTGSRILELVLIGRGDGDGPMPFNEVAAMMGLVQRQPREIDQSFETRCRREGEKVGWAFRDALRLLASHWQYGDAPKLPEPKWGR
jgi:hypothetical protein